MSFAFGKRGTLVMESMKMIKNRESKMDHWGAPEVSQQGDLSRTMHSLVLVGEIVTEP